MSLNQNPLLQSTGRSSWIPTTRKDGLYLVQFCRGPLHMELRVLDHIQPCLSTAPDENNQTFHYKLRWGFMGGSERDLPDLLYDWVEYVPVG